jgi:hypothetical protein
VPVIASALAAGSAQAEPAARHPVSREHPRLLGSRQELQALARERAQDYQRVVQVARVGEADDYAKMISLALVAAIERDETLGRQVQQMAMRYVTGPIRQGHVPFGTDLALCTLAYDLCFECWSDADRAQSDLSPAMTFIATAARLTRPAKTPDPRRSVGLRLPRSRRTRRTCFCTS